MTIRPLLRKLLPARARTFLKSFLTRPQPEAADRRFLAGFKEFCVGAPSHRALVSYLVDPLLPPPEQRDRTMFSNRGIAQQIPQALNELGYVVDIVQWDDLTWQPTDRYDLFVGHGGVNYERIAHKLIPDTVRIYFSTGIYWKESNVREAQRLNDLTVRRGHLLQPDRCIRQSEEYANRAANGIICLGNQEAIKTYRHFPLVLGINNGVYPVTWNGWKDKDYQEGRQHFLFFSGGGNIHKGLDLLLEAFTGTQLHLYVCQNIEPGFGDVYRYELTECPNIHTYGQIPMRSPSFEALAMQCNWVISATCAEGQPGATLECMGYGLIPILPPSANIDLGGFGLLLPDCNVGTIRATVLNAAQTPIDECRRRSLLTRDAICHEYSPERFNRNFKQAVRQIAAAKANRQHLADTADDHPTD